MVLGIIRHGVTDWNKVGRNQGQTDIPLNAEGREQARALANRLIGEAWDVIYASDLSRAKETAEIVAGMLDLTVQLDQRLREKGFGDLEGTTEQERIDRWGADWKALDHGIEKDEAMIERGRTFIADVMERYPNQRILIVSHGAFIGLTLGQLIPHENKEGSINNTSMSLLRYTRDQWECELYNCAKHL
jgi:probable phosphoglycerate mutase